MATVNLSISSEDCYWKVTILCGIIALMFMCEHFIYALVKWVANILNSLLLLNQVVSMMADRGKDYDALQKLQTINRVTATHRKEE